jgi:undecaprenyl diphosphate synthase
MHSGLTEKEIQDYTLDLSNLPQHIAIIMDGNGRWAKQRNLPRTIGHQQGSNTLREILKASLDLGIQYLTVYAFSSENWSRPKTEVAFLTKLFKTMLIKELNSFHKKKVRVRIIGDKSAFDEDLKEKFAKVEKETESYTALNFNICSNYGSRQEIIHAIQSLIKHNPPLNSDDITETLISDHLYTSGIPDPDLLIRTSGEQRLSNFLLWQLSYTELVFHDKNWPDFSRSDYLQVIKNYQQRHRRFGGL